MKPQLYIQLGDWFHFSGGFALCIKNYAPQRHHNSSDRLLSLKYVFRPLRPEKMAMADLYPLDLLY